MRHGNSRKAAKEEKVCNNTTTQGALKPLLIGKKRKILKKEIKKVDDETKVLDLTSLPKSLNKPTPVTCAVLP